MSVGMSRAEDVGDEKKVKKKKNKQQLVRERELEEIRQVISTAFGRRFLWRILIKCGMFQTLSGYTELSMAIKSGKRDMGLWLVNEINEADKNGYIKLIQEDLKDA